MPGNQLEIPILNPLHFIPEVPGTPDQYKTRYYEDYLYADTLYDFQEEGDFYPTFLTIDPIALQMTSNFAPLQLRFQNGDDDDVITPINMAQVRANKYVPGSWLFESLSNLAGLGGQTVRARLIPGGNEAAAQRSEWFCIKDNIKKSMLIEYYNSRFHGDVVFETGIKFGLRIPGMIDEKEPGMSDVMYQDQVLNNTLLSSKPFDQYKIWVGSEVGVAPWMIRKINWALSCDHCAFDGKLLSKYEGSKWASHTEEGMKLKGYDIDLTPSLNRASKIINPAIDPNKKVTLIYNIGSNIFGSVDNQGGAITTPVIGYE